VVKGQIPWNKGKHGVYSEETLRKMSEPRKGRAPWNKGKKASEGTREKISAALRQRICSEETRAKRRIAMTGKRWTDEHKNKIRQAHLGRKQTPEHREKCIKNLRPGNNKGKRLSPETIRKIVASRVGKYTGERSYQWKGGISFEPYCPKFNNDLKERVRAFFGYTCLVCGTPQNGERLSIHHINYNKKGCCDNSVPLFAPLCRVCHSKTSHHRDLWQSELSDIINQYYEGKCYFSKEEMAAYCGDAVK
jgi:hypothetical protein